MPDENNPPGDFSGNVLYVSASQLETKRTCKRKWWLQKVARQPEEDKGYLEFGTVLHAVAERWMGADDRGCGPDGEPVDLYPAGWESQNDRGIPLPVEQQDLIRRLIEEAIKRGILRRSEGRQVEQKLDLELVPAEGASPAIRFVGKVDVLLPTGVEDHKSIGNWRYAETSDSLRRNPQLLMYCWGLRELYHCAGETPPEKYLVRHNQFGKDPAKPKVGHAEAWVTDADIDRAAFLARRDAEEMARWREVEKWQDVPGADKDWSGGCRKYGGCAYVRICSGELDLDQHRALTESLNADRLRTRLESSERQTLKRQETAMGSDALTKAMAARAARNGAAAPAKAAAPELNSGVGTVAAPAAPAVDVSNAGAPWADPTCPACDKAKALIRGVTGKGGVCVVCDTRSKRAGRPTSVDFIVTPGQQPGTVTWTPKPGSAAAGRAATTATVPSAPTQEVASPAEEAQQAVDDAAAETIANADRLPDEDLTEAEQAAVKSDLPVPGPQRKAKAAPVAGPPAEPVQRAVPTGTGRPTGRPRKGFTLYIGCRPTRGASTSEPPVFVSQLLRAYMDAIAEASNADFFSLDPFKRRDAIVSRAMSMGDDIGTRDVIADSRDILEARNLIDALRDQANKVIEAVA